MPIARGGQPEEGVERQTLVPSFHGSETSSCADIRDSHTFRASPSMAL